MREEIPQLTGVLEGFPDDAAPVGAIWPPGNAASPQAAVSPQTTAASQTIGSPRTTVSAQTAVSPQTDGPLRLGGFSKDAGVFRDAGFARDAVLPGGAVLPVLPALAELLPAGGLARGSVIAVDQPGLLCLALVAAASAAGAWCGVAGIPDLGVAAAAGMGVQPARLMLVAHPGPGWPQVVASMLEACEVVVVRPPDRPPAQIRRRLEGALRRGGGVLVAAGEWEGAPVRLRVARRSWAGIGDGYGSLRACRAEVVAAGRGAVARPRRRWLWLPAPDGTVTTDETADAGCIGLPGGTATAEAPGATPAFLRAAW